MTSQLNFALLRSMKKILLLAVLLVVTGCTTSQPKRLIKNTSVPEVPSPDNLIFGERPNIETKESLFFISEQRKKHFFDYYNDPNLAHERPNVRVYNYLENYLDNFNYHANTFTAEETLEQNNGNCLTLAILTYAFAQIVDIKTGLQLVQAPPVYQRKGDIMLTSQHIRTLLYDSDTEDNKQSFWNTTGLAVDYFPGRETRVLRRVDFDEFVAMYYRNKASEAIVEKKLSKAYWYVMEALKHFPAESDSINTLAVIYSRSGLPKLAMRVYEYGLKHSRHKLELISNYHSLLKRLKKHRKAKEIAQLLANYEDPNPFRWIDLGHKAYKEQSYSKALRYYRKANKLAPYLHEGYAGIARVRYQMGHYKRAHKSINLALNNTFYKKARNVYQEKLNLLTNLLESGL